MHDEDKIKIAAELIKNSTHVTAFTGAGISVESGIPSFRGKDGLWEKYDPIFLDINYFFKEPLKSWELNKEIFYYNFDNSFPNKAHKILAKMEEKGMIHSIITQNIDYLHQRAGSKKVYEFHGTSHELICTKCGRIYKYKKVLLNELPPRCENCGGILKPNYVFFGEAINESVRSLSFKEAELADLFIIIGTTGEIQPASLIPLFAKESGAMIIEININKTNYTDKITDVFLRGKASERLENLSNLLFI
jgi:NAD-dependent deacetylase